MSFSGRLEILLDLFCFPFITVADSWEDLFSASMAWIFGSFSPVTLTFAVNSCLCLCLYHQTDIHAQPGPAHWRGNSKYSLDFRSVDIATCWIHSGPCYDHGSLAAVACMSNMARIKPSQNWEAQLFTSKPIWASKTQIDFSNKMIHLSRFIIIMIPWILYPYSLCPSYIPPTTANPSIRPSRYPEAHLRSQPGANISIVTMKLFFFFQR